MMPLALALLVAIVSLTQPATLRARFIGNMALAIDDGTTTLMTDSTVVLTWAGTRPRR
jgi:hypothetical protein